MEKGSKKSKFMKNEEEKGEKRRVTGWKKNEE